MSEDRKDILLRAAYDILKRCDDGPYVKTHWESARVGITPTVMVGV